MGAKGRRRWMSGIFKTFDLSLRLNSKLQKMLEDTIIIDTPKHDFKNIKEAKDWAKKNINIYANQF
jgi:hypothetical protein